MSLKAQAVQADVDCQDQGHIRGGEILTPPSSEATCSSPSLTSTSPSFISTLTMPRSDEGEHRASSIEEDGASYEQDFEGKGSRPQVLCDKLEEEFPEVEKEGKEGGEEGKSALEQIPKVLFQCVKSKEDLNERKQCGFLSSERRMGDFKRLVFSNEEQREFVGRYYPEMVEFFDKARYDIQRADLWRYLVIYRYGGVYLDADTIVLRRFDDWVSMKDTNGVGIRLVVGIEGSINTGSYPTVRRHQVSMAQFAAAPGHPFLGFLLKRIFDEADPLARTAEDVLNFAGPGRFTDVLEEYLRKQYGAELKEVIQSGGNRLVGDVYILSVNGFGCGQQHSGSRPCKGNREALTWEGFEGSWRDKIYSNEASKTAARVVSSSLSDDEEIQASLLQLLYSYAREAELTLDEIQASLLRLLQDQAHREGRRLEDEEARPSVLQSVWHEEARKRTRMEEEL